MARRRLLTREALARHYDPPIDEREIARHFTVNREDLDLVGERRGASSRLGFVMLLLYMRWPGRVLEAGEKPPGAILAFVADQIDVPATAFDDYAGRDETRRAHLVDLMQHFGYAAFNRNHFRAIVAFAMPVAQTVAPASLARRHRNRRVATTTGAAAALGCHRGDRQTRAPAGRATHS